MKKASKSAANWVALCVLGLGFSAWATGQPGTQGPRFLGMGLDEPFHNSDGSYTPGQVQFYTLIGAATFPPTDETNISSANPTSFTLTNLKCKPRNGRVAHCEANVTSQLSITPHTGMNSNVCSVSNPSEKIKLVAINAAWNPMTNGLDFTPTNAVVFACRDIHPSVSDPFDSIGALGKCVGWGFLANSEEEFLTCVRATRADYCGTGTSYTEMGTPFVAYDLPSSSRHVCIRGECFEASWDTRGATCINHLRYEALVELAESMYRQQGGSDGGQQNPTGHDQRLSVDSLRVCGVEDTPLSQCLAKYKDLYYDDQHPMNLVNPSTINLITSQYVCLPGAQRIVSQGLLSRTKVRFMNASGAITPLDCCDTLGCP
jgi:ADYC domain